MNNNSLNYNTQIRRLALGMAFEDELSRKELIYPVRVESEQTIPHLSPLPRGSYTFEQSGRQVPEGLLRHGTGRYSLSYFPGIKGQIDLRIFDYARNYVPRRLRVPLLTLVDVLDIEESELENYLEGRVRDVIMFPGAAYDCLSKVTGLRGRVERNDRPMRWAYIEARDVGSNTIIARTRGDDRGEFLLILPSLAAQASELNSTLDVRVSIVGPEVEPVADSPDLIANDIYWDLPLEELPSLGEVDNVSSGESFPTGFVTALSAVRIVSFQLGRLLTGREIDDFDFSI